MEDFDVYITKEWPYYYCNFCQTKKDKSITNIRYHIETKHYPGTFIYPCSVCGKNLDSKIRFRDHSKVCFHL